MDNEAKAFWRLAAEFNRRAHLEGPRGLNVTSSKNYILVTLNRREVPRSVVVRYYHGDGGPKLTYSIPTGTIPNSSREIELVVSETQTGATIIRDDDASMTIEETGGKTHTFTTWVLPLGGCRAALKWDLRTFGAGQRERA